MAVYTAVSETDIKRIESLYGFRGVQLKPIAEGVENSNYLLTHENDRTILTLYEQRVAKSDLPFFLGLMQHLAKKKVPCPLPIPGTDGAVVHEIAGKEAAIVSFLSGKSVTRSYPEHCREVGKHLAQMHLAGEGFSISRKNALSLPAWPVMWNAITAKAEKEWSGTSTIIDAQMKRLQTEWPTQLPKGIIHADLFPDNVFFEGEALSGIIDFYFACNDMLAYDLAICLNAWCFEPNYEFNITKSQRMLEGYATLRPLSAEEKAAFPILCLGAAMRFLMTRMTDWLNPKPDALVTPKNPMEYFQKLKFHATAKDFHAYGI